MKYGKILLALAFLIASPAIAGELQEFIPFKNFVELCQMPYKQRLEQFPSALLPSRYAPTDAECHAALRRRPDVSESVFKHFEHEFSLMDEGTLTYVANFILDQLSIAVENKQWPRFRYYFRLYKIIQDYR